MLAEHELFLSPEKIKCSLSTMSFTFPEPCLDIALHDLDVLIYELYLICHADYLFSHSIKLFGLMRTVTLKSIVRDELSKSAQ
jgi:hypothetical protein